MGKFIDLTDQIFGYLKVLKRSIKTNKHSIIYWDCICLNCGKLITIIGDSLKNGATTSCGCMQYQAEDLTNQIFDGWKVLGKSTKTNSYNTIYWDCECLGCGIIRPVIGHRLKSGSSKSCGDTKNCEVSFIIKSIAQQSHGLTNSIIYASWIAIKTRCYNMLSLSYINYGGRGIIMYTIWIDDFQAFYNYLQTLPETLEQFIIKNPNKIPTIGRIDNNGNYEPGNIRWETTQEQSQNRRSNVLTIQLVKFILWEYKINNRTYKDIFKIIKSKYNYDGSYGHIREIVIGKNWYNINIDKEIAEYKKFGTVNGIVIPKV